MTPAYIPSNKVSFVYDSECNVKIFREMQQTRGPSPSEATRWDFVKTVPDMCDAYKYAGENGFKVVFVEPGVIPVSGIKDESETAFEYVIKVGDSFIENVVFYYGKVQWLTIKRAGVDAKVYRNPSEASHAAQKLRDNGISAEVDTRKMIAPK